MGTKPYMVAIDWPNETNGPSDIRSVGVTCECGKDAWVALMEYVPPELKADICHRLVAILDRFLSLCL